jgi:glycosyltransferase involved in cell wall biosynthesis
MPVGSVPIKLDSARLEREILPASGRSAPIAERAADAAQSSAARPIRVALVLYRDNLHVGGSLRVVEVLANAFNPDIVEAHLVFAYGEPGPVAKNSKVPCHFLRARGPHDVLGWVRARRMVAQLDPDILHFHNPVYWLHAALAGTRYKKLAHLHGPFFPATMSWLSRLLVAQTHRLVDAEVCLSREMRNMVLQLGWGTPDRTWTVHNAIDCGSFEKIPSKHEGRAALGLPQDCLLLGMVCRLAWYKGCRDAVRILARLDKRWHLVFCGDGPMRKYLVDVARQEGVEHRTHFTGMLDDMRVAYGAMDASLFLSKLEPFGLIIAEAMASKVPVFGLAAEGQYNDGLYPLVTPRNSVFVDRTLPGDYGSPEPSPVLDELSARINDFGKQPEAYGPMIDEAYSWVRKRFDSKVQSESMCEIYEALLGRPTDAPVR